MAHVIIDLPMKDGDFPVGYDSLPGRVNSLYMQKCQPPARSGLALLIPLRKPGI